MSQEKDKKTMPKQVAPSAQKKLEAKVAKTQEAVEQYYATYEAKAHEYREILGKNEDKSAIFHAKYAVKVAKLYYKIKIADHKLAKFDLKTAQKALKKLAKTEALEQKKTAAEQAKADKKASKPPQP